MQFSLQTEFPIIYCFLRNLIFSNIEGGFTTCLNDKIDIKTIIISFKFSPLCEFAFLL